MGKILKEIKEFFDNLILWNKFGCQKQSEK